VPCFELWLLLHYIEVQGALHRNQAYQRLRNYISTYEKGQENVFDVTQDALPVAIGRGRMRKERYSRLPGNDAYTDVHELVTFLVQLRKPR
jgi:hypothetical protein